MRYTAIHSANLIVFNFDACPNTETLIDELERFVESWVTPILTPRPKISLAKQQLPRPLERVLAINESYEGEIFACLHSLLPPDRLEIHDQSVYFLDINQTGQVVSIPLDNSDDPPVYWHDNNRRVKCSDSLAEYLVSFALQELLYWAAMQENEFGECWDVDFPMVAERHGYANKKIWTDKTSIWPRNLASFHLIDDHVLTMEQPDCDVRFVSSAVKLSPDLQSSVLIEYPNWI